ncbi:MAG: hypothetical protein ACJ71C_06655 [Nitrososphaeraceae archaeon]
MSRVLGFWIIIIIMFPCSVICRCNFTAQSLLQTIKNRDLVIDLGNGVKTSAQLTIPAVGEGPFPGVLLIPVQGQMI